MANGSSAFPAFAPAGAAGPPGARPAALVSWCEKKIPVLSPPAAPPKVCTQTAVTIAPDLGARFRQDLPYGTETWRATCASYRNTIERTNGFLKDPAHEALAAPGRRRVRGICAQSLFVAFLVMAGNVRKITAHRKLVADRAQRRAVERARRRRITLVDFRPPP